MCELGRDFGRPCFTAFWLPGWDATKLSGFPRLFISEPLSDHEGERMSRSEGQPLRRASEGRAKQYPGRHYRIHDRASYAIAASFQGRAGPFDELPRYVK